MFKIIDQQTAASKSALRNAILYTSIIGWLRPNEPFFRHWDRLPKSTREHLAKLKSDDIIDDHLLVRKQ